MEWIWLGRGIGIGIGTGKSSLLISTSRLRATRQKHGVCFGRHFIPLFSTAWHGHGMAQNDIGNDLGTE
jgi:hypothetical protein